MNADRLPVRRKVFAYITDRRNRLLVFSHPDFPEAGIQVPAGTVMPDEDPAAALLREAREATGLTDLVLVDYLGEQLRDRRDDGRPELHHHHFFHLAARGDVPESWAHCEMDPSDGSPPVRFAFSRAPLPNGVPPLIGGHDALLPELVERLAGARRGAL